MRARARALCRVAEKLLLIEKIAKVAKTFGTIVVALRAMPIFRARETLLSSKTNFPTDLRSGAAVS